MNGDARTRELYTNKKLSEFFHAIRAIK